MLNYRKDGTAFWNALSLAPIHDRSGKLTHWVGVLTDVTPFKRLEAQFLQAQKMEAVGQLAGGVAHDFNNLLTIITGYSDLVLAGLDRHDDMRGMIEEIHKAEERAAGLTRQLLAFSRKQVLQPRVLDLNDLVVDVQKMLGRLIGEDIQLFTTLSPSLGRVKADPGQIEQILVNLAVNARDAMPDGGELVVETSDVDVDAAFARDCPELRPGRYTVLTFTDTGCGMDKQTLDRIFEPFFTTKGQGRGTGLGLATVYGIVKQSGGYVYAQSEVGKGSAFRVYLPVVEEDAAFVDAPRRRGPVPRGKETVLLVEDEEGVRELARQVLQMNGYKVLEAENGQEDLRVAEGNGGMVDLLLTDVVMPHLGGRGLAEQMASLYPDVKVLYMSGYTDDAVIRTGVLQSENEFLQKPFTTTALLDKVREVLDKRDPRLSHAGDPPHAPSGAAVVLRRRHRARQVEVNDSRGEERVEQADRRPRPVSGAEAPVQRAARHVTPAVIAASRRGRRRSAAVTERLSVRRAAVEADGRPDQRRFGVRRHAPAPVRVVVEERPPRGRPRARGRRLQGAGARPAGRANPVRRRRAGRASCRPGTLLRRARPGVARGRRRPWSGRCRGRRSVRPKRPRRLRLRASLRRPRRRLADCRRRRARGGRRVLRHRAAAGRRARPGRTGRVPDGAGVRSARVALAPRIPPTDEQFLQCRGQCLTENRVRHGDARQTPETDRGGIIHPDARPRTAGRGR